MKKQMTFSFSITPISAIVIFCFCIFSISQNINAQIIGQTNAAKEQNPELEIIQKSASANSFYEKLQQYEKTKGNEWTLAHAGYLPKSSTTRGAKVSHIYLEKGRSEVRLILTEDEVGSNKDYFGQISQGVVKNCKGGSCGDEGQKIYGTHGFSSLGFRKDNYFVDISCNSEETAMRFAGYALKAIAEK